MMLVVELSQNAAEAARVIASQTKLDVGEVVERALLEWEDRLIKEMLARGPVHTRRRSFTSKIVE